MERYKPKNREKVKSSKQGKFWCGVCDAYKLHDGDKCPKCGQRQKTKTLKRYYLDHGAGI